MRIAMLNPPFRYGADPTQWITVPPQGYGGIQWVVSHLIDGLIELGHEVVLLGAPGSQPRPGLTVLAVTSAAEAARALAEIPVDVIHDHSNGTMLTEQSSLPWSQPTTSPGRRPSGRTASTCRKRSDGRPGRRPRR